MWDIIIAETLIFKDIKIAILIYLGQNNSDVYYFKGKSVAIFYFKDIKIAVHRVLRTKE